MKSFITLFFIILFLTFKTRLLSQTDNLGSISQKFLELYNAGDIISADQLLLKAVESGNKIPREYEIFIYNSLGVTSSFMSRFTDALYYYNLAEKSLLSSGDTSDYLGGIYQNMAIIYGYQKSYQSAIEFYEKGIRIYQNSIRKGNDSYLNLSKAFLNLGIIYYEISQYNLALTFFEKSINIKLKYNLSGLPLVYLNVAKTQARLDNSIMAEEYYNKAINKFIIDYGNNYFRLAEVYFDYGVFLRDEKRYLEALQIHNKALSICIKNYGENHTLTSLAYKHIGDHYSNLDKYDSALFYYQKSLIALVPDFNDDDIYKNPSTDSSLSDIRLLSILKSKAGALKLLSDRADGADQKLKLMFKSHETIDLAIGLISKIRNSFPSEESSLYIAEIEKETYEYALNLVNDIFYLTGEESWKHKAYDIVRNAKSAVLLDEITGIEILLNAGLPDSLIKKRNDLERSVSAYNNFILDESVKESPDSAKLSLWKDAVFDMNREKENLNGQVDSLFPGYDELIARAGSVPVREIQKHLTGKEVIIDYFLCNGTSQNGKDLYTFLITRKKLEFVKTKVDSLFKFHINAIRNGFGHGIQVTQNNDSCRIFKEALFYMYKILIMPVEGYLHGKKVIIIPDEDISWIPFDALLHSSPDTVNSDFEGLDYLINKYSFSYGFSSSLLSGNKSSLKKTRLVFSFAPEYKDERKAVNEPVGLPGTLKEIESIYRWFKGEKYQDKMATETNFRNSVRTSAIFHLAMHSVSDTLNSKYSFLQFDGQTDSINDGRLYNYEISLVRINSPMVVLSACNSGTGTLYHGEGLISLARSFILAGASSVIRTSWEVNDEVSSKIITEFYRNLSHGMPKDEALRSAKLDFIRSNPPSFAHPYYWASYDLAGDNRPVAGNRYVLFVVIIALVFCCTGFLYLMR